MSVRRPEADRLLDDVLNDLKVTDRVFHGLKQSMPLVRRLVETIERVAPEGRVLVIGSNTLLARALVELGHPTQLWQVPEGSLAGELKPRVARMAPLEELLAGGSPPGSFDIIVLPYILEAAEEEPGAVLSRLREQLAPEGRVLVASASAGRLIYRLRALMGRSQLQPSQESAPVSLSWPSLPVRRLIDPSNLRHWAGQAGFQVEEQGLMMDRYATMPIEAMRVKDWVLAEGTHLVRRSIPALRDCLVATLAPFQVRDLPGAAPGVEVATATVVVFASDPARCARLLADLDEQTFDPERMQVVVVHGPGQNFEELTHDPHRFSLTLLPCNPPVGPRAANAGLRICSSDVVAFTDDACRVPPAWVESGVAATSGWTAAASGEVLGAGDGPHPILNLPGARPTRTTELDRGFFPSWNSFYLRRPLAEAGGFDESMEEAEGPMWGWDSEPAHRLEALGYRVSFEDTIFVFREFPHQSGGWLAAEFRRASQMAEAVARMPGLRRTQLRERIFATHRTRAFLLLVLGVLLGRGRRRTGYLLLAFPWMKSAAGLARFWPPSSWPAGGAAVGELALRHAAWLAGFVWGSARSRKVVL